MSLRIDEHNLSTNKISEDKTIIALSDLYINSHFSKEMLKSISNYLKGINNPDLILIPGNLVSSWKTNNSNFEMLYHFLKTISQKSNIVTSLGTSDITKLDDEILNKYLELNNIPQVHALFNSSVLIDDINVHSLSPSKEAEKNTQKFINEYLKYFGHIDDYNLNILLNYNPLLIKDKFVLSFLEEFLEDIDLIVSGEMKVLDKNKFNKIIKYQHGLYSLDFTKLLATKGLNMKTNPTLSKVNIIAK